jgi:hypothetical protein
MRSSAGHCKIWNFEALTAPAGFNPGIYDIKQDSIFTSFSGENFRFLSAWIKS